MTQETRKKLFNIGGLLIFATGTAMIGYFAYLVVYAFVKVVLEI